MSNEIIQPMSPNDVKPFLARHPKPWQANYMTYGHLYILDGANNEIDADDLAAYALFLEFCRVSQRGEIEAFKEDVDKMSPEYDRLRRAHEPDFHCKFCDAGVLDDDAKFVSRGSVFCSQQCISCMEAIWERPTK